ncbi:Homeodomain-like protein [Dioscorea alata]|uniref:Homeodomain-like protein n=2 Tax=Dioscorea alata TaxID=55571 RepID=A0ACB7TZ34_DIOAL|nr:Homeodomain-like protein [Dioscorea alata]KAH7653336.1 Homeodomain-like protein [Dioscorea alata]
MAADSNASFHQGLVPSSMYHSRLVSFQSGATNSVTGTVPAGLNNSGAINSTGGMLLAANPSMIPNASSVIQSGCSSSNILLDSVPCLKHDTGLVVEWTPEEQALLKQGLIKYANEPNIMKYIKIAAILGDKTVRDVALRCRWMLKRDIFKRRKSEENYLGKKIKDRKEKTVDLPLKMNMTPVPSNNTQPYSQLMHQEKPVDLPSKLNMNPISEDYFLLEKMVESLPKMNANPVPSNNIPAYSQLMHQVPQNQFFYEAPVIDSATRNLLEENVRILGQIKANLSTFKVQDNIPLFYRMRNNVATILMRMSHMPGVMGRMPPLPVSTNEQLLSNMLPSLCQFF